MSLRKEDMVEIMEDLLKNKIDNFEIIIIELENVLYAYNYMTQYDYYYYICSKWNEKRVLCNEFAASRIRVSCELADKYPSIEDIYYFVQKELGLSDKEKFELISLEKQCMLKSLCFREAMVEYVKYAINNNKIVYLIEDTVWDSVVLGKILEEREITGYKKILLTSERKICKAEMIEGILTAENCSCLTILQEELVECIAKDICIIKNSLEMLKSSSYKKVLTHVKSINDRMLLKRFANHIFNHPLSQLGSDGRPEISKPYDLGYLFIAPLATGFLIWLLNYGSENNYDRILFSARDGYIVQRLYRIGIEKLNLQDMPKDIYLQISRTLCVAASVYCEKDIENYARVRCNLSPEEMLIRRFGLEKNEIQPFIKEKYTNEIEYSLAHREKILKKSEKIRNNYRTYIAKIGIRVDMNCAFFDFVSSGTCQYFLEKIVPIHLTGVYACHYLPFHGITNYTDIEAKNKLKIDSYVVNKSVTERESYFFEDYNFLESIFTSLDPSVCRMDEGGIPVFDEEKRSEEEKLYVKEVHKAIEDFFCEYLEFGYIEGNELNFNLVDKLFEFKNLSYTNEHCSLLDEFYLVEDFGQGKIKLQRK